MWTAWNPSDVAGTTTNAGAAGTTDDSIYVTLANSSGTLTCTFNTVGKYSVNLGFTVIHGGAFTIEQLLLTLSGTATKRIGTDPGAGVENGGGDRRTTLSASFMVNATVADQTLTILPSYSVTGAGAAGNYINHVNATFGFCGA